MTKRPMPRKPTVRALAAADLQNVQGGATKDKPLEYYKIELKEVIVSSVG